MARKHGPPPALLTFALGPKKGDLVELTTAGQRRRRLIVFLAPVGLLVAAFGGIYAQLTDAARPHFDLAVWVVLMILCPPSLVFVPLIDVEPGTFGFAVTWLAIAVMNSALYALIGLGIGRLVWRSGKQGSTFTP